MYQDTVKVSKKWDFNSYAIERSPYQYDKERTFTLPLFHTKVQEDAYFGYIRIATVHKHQYINMTFLIDKDITAGLITLGCLIFLNTIAIGMT
jgi:hypothetical protein